MKNIVYKIVFVILIFIPIQVKAYTGSETVNLITDNNWFNYFDNVVLNDNISYTSNVLNYHLNYIHSQIQQDLMTTNSDYYIISQVQYSSVNKNIVYTIRYLTNLNQFSTLILNTYAFENSSGHQVQFRGTIYTTHTRTITFNNSDNTNVNIGSLITSSSFLQTSTILFPFVDRLNLKMPTTFWVDTNIPKYIIDTLRFKTDSSTSYPLLNINNTLLPRNTTYYVTDFFNFVTIIDDVPPILDFLGIIQPQWLWKGDTYNVPMPTAIDNIDGDITSNIQVTSNLNVNIVGNYTINYSICDSSNNCTFYNMPVEVRETMKSIDMTGKYAILFYYKDFSKVLTPNAYCDSIELQGSCFVQQFEYLGRWKYSKISLNDLNTLLYENGGIYAPLDSQFTSYTIWNHINIGHTTNDFVVGVNEYGVLMYNESGANIIKIKYNQKYFSYILFNSPNDTDQKIIDYIDGGGITKNTSTLKPPYTNLEDPATVNNPTTSGLFSSFTTNTYGLTAIISAPLNLINQLTSKECSQIILPLPYLENKHLVLPCMTTIYQTYFGLFFILYQIITFGVIAYWVIVRLLNMVKDFKNPYHDEIEVFDL